MTDPAPEDVLAVGDSGPRPDDFRAEVQLVLEFIEQVWNEPAPEPGGGVLGA